MSSSDPELPTSSTEAQSPSPNYDYRPGVLNDWLAVDSLAKDHQIAHQNHQDARRLAGRIDPNQTTEDDEMINVDSPTTVTNHYPPPAGKKASLLPAVAVAASLAFGPAAGIVAYQAPKIIEAFTNTKPTPAGTDTDTQFDLYAGPPKTARD